jgi:hypothetical protein
MKGSDLALRGVSYEFRQFLEIGALSPVLVERWDQLADLPIGLPRTLTKFPLHAAQLDSLSRSDELDGDEIA